jgi:hypothetical protein
MLPHRPDDGVLDWALDAVLTSREINRGFLTAAAGSASA